MNNIFVSGANRGIGHALTLYFQGIPTNSLFCGIRNVESDSNVFSNFKNISVTHFDLLNEITLTNPGKEVLKSSNGFDVVINNAGVNYFHEKSLSSCEKARFTLTINFINQVFFIEDLLNSGAIKSGAQLINVSSSIGTFSILRNKDLIKRILDAKFSHQLLQIANEYIEICKSDQLWVSKTHPWPEYAFSKLLFSIYTEILSQDPRILKNNVQVYSMCPGWIKTRIGGKSAPLTVDHAVKHFENILNQKTVDQKIQGLFYSENQFSSLRKKFIEQNNK